MAGLLCDTNEGGSPAQLFQLGSTHVGAGGAETPQHVEDGVVHISSVGNLHCPALRRPEWSRERGIVVQTVNKLNTYEKLFKGE